MQDEHANCKHFMYFQSMGMNQFDFAISRMSNALYHSTTFAPFGCLTIDKHPVLNGVMDDVLVAPTLLLLHFS